MVVRVIRVNNTSTTHKRAYEIVRNNMLVLLVESGKIRQVIERERES